MLNSAEKQKQYKEPNHNFMISNKVFKIQNNKNINYAQRIPDQEKTIVFFIYKIIKLNNICSNEFKSN